MDLSKKTLNVCNHILVYGLLHFCETIGSNDRFPKIVTLPLCDDCRIFDLIC
jgi:hypothetical protein